MNFFSSALVLGLIALAACANNYDQYGPQPGKSSHKTKQTHQYQEAQGRDKNFNAEEVQNILMSAVPGKDYPIYSLDYMPQTSFKCDGPNIHYPGYYADVEAGCQVFHYCPPKVEEPTYQQPQGGYHQMQEQQPDEQYRKKRESYGQHEMPATYYGQDDGSYGQQEEQEQEPPKYQPPPKMPVTYDHRPKYHPAPPQKARIEPYPQPQQQPQYEQEEQLISYLCPNQTIFNQQTLTCEWFYNVICEHAVQNYDLANSRLYQENAPLLDEIPEVEHPSGLNTAPAPRPQQTQTRYQPQEPDYQPQEAAPPAYHPKQHKMPSRRPTPQQARYNEIKY